jgi:hypothetical protein
MNNKWNQVGPKMHLFKGELLSFFFKKKTDAAIGGCSYLLNKQYSGC